MTSFKISSKELEFLHHWGTELTKHTGDACFYKESAEEIRIAIEKAYHSISQGHSEHEITVSDGAIKYMHDGLLKYQADHSSHLSKVDKENLASLIRTFSC